MGTHFKLKTQADTNEKLITMGSMEQGRLEWFIQFNTEWFVI